MAQEQIFEIAQYIVEKFQALESARRFIDRMEAKISELDTMPERVALIKEEPWYNKGVHKYIVSNYIVYFIILEPEHIVRVIAVVPDRMDRKRQLEQMEIS